MSIFKKLAKWLSILFLVVVAIVTVIPMLFQDEIVEKVKAYARESIRAEIDFGDIDLTLFANFPRLTVLIDSIRVDGVEEFKGVTLAKMSQMQVSVDLASVMSEHIRIHKIGLIEPVIDARVLANGKANWDIAVEEPAAAQIEEGTITLGSVKESETSAEMGVGVEEYFIKRGKVNYRDAVLGAKIAISGLNHNGNLELQEEMLTVNSSTSIGRISVVMPQLIHGDLAVTDLSTNLAMRGESIAFNSLKMKVLGGDISGHGDYETRGSGAWMDMSLSVVGLDMQDAAGTFVTVAKLIPVARSLKGQFTTSLRIETQLNELMEPVLSSLTGSGNFSSNDIRIENFAPLDKISKLLRKPDWAKQQFKDLELEFGFDKGTATIPPFKIELGGIETSVSGTHSFDQQINYTLVMKVPRSELGGEINKSITGLSDKLKAAGIKSDPAEIIDLTITIARARSPIRS